MSSQVSPVVPPSAVRAYIAFGANLGHPLSAFDFACRRIAALPDTRLLQHSSLFRTAAHGVDTEQPDYINAVIAVDTALSPRRLLEALLAIETAGGRTREPLLRTPRTLDLDLLLYQDAVIHESGLEVPHPRMHERAFVLVPLAEIAPDILIPTHGAIVTLLSRVAEQTIAKL